MGTYKTSLSSTARCIPCPGNSMTTNSSSTACDCIRGTVRCPSRPDDACQLLDDFFASKELSCTKLTSYNKKRKNPEFWRGRYFCGRLIFSPVGVFGPVSFLNFPGCTY